MNYNNYKLYLDNDHNLDILENIQNTLLITNITLLSVSHNSNINNKYIKLISNMLKENTTLTTLYLENNRIRDEGVKYICDALKTNTTLQFLNLAQNPITDIGAKYIGDMLKQNSSLRTLFLDNTNIGLDGDEYIITSLEENRSITIMTTNYTSSKNKDYDRVLSINNHNIRLKSMSLIDLSYGIKIENIDIYVY
jgi:Ran GTPase-activating protein (RanGAP) involved in mRNA processing and transport